MLTINWSKLSKASHHLHHLHHSIDAQMIEEGDEVFLHLDAVIVHLSHSENAHLALPPNLQDRQGTILHICYYLLWKQFVNLLRSWQCSRCFVFWPCADGAGRGGASASLHRGRSTTRLYVLQWSALHWMGNWKYSLAPTGPYWR